MDFGVVVTSTATLSVQASGTLRGVGGPPGLRASSVSDVLWACAFGDSVAPAPKTNDPEESRRGRFPHGTLAGLSDLSVQLEARQ